MELNEEIKYVSNQLKEIRRGIRKLKVEEDSLCNRLTRLLELSVNQTKIDFDELGDVDQGDGPRGPEAPLA